MLTTLGDVLVVSDDESFRKRFNPVVGSNIASIRFVGLDDVRSDRAKGPGVTLLHVPAPRVDRVRMVRAEVLRGSSRMLLVVGARLLGDGVTAALLDAGACDVIDESIGDEALIARIRAALRRAPFNDLGDEPGAISIDLDACRAVVSGAKLELRRAEFRLLACLSVRGDKLISAAELAASALDRHDDGGTAAIRVHVSRLRAKLATVGCGIETIPGCGYRLRAPSEREQRQVPAPRRRPRNAMAGDGARGEP